DARFHYSGCQQSALDRIRRLSVAEVRLDRVRQRFEQAAILPGPDVKTRRKRLRLTGDAAGEVEPRTIGSNLDGQATEPVPIVDQNGPRGGAQELRQLRSAIRAIGLGVPGRLE